MANQTTKKQLILDYAQAHHLQRVGAQEIRALDHELRRRLGPAHHTSSAYIVNVLRDAGAHVLYNSRFVDSDIEEPYASRLNGLLRFRDLESTEKTIQKLDAIYREYRGVSDRVGTCLVRSLAVRGKQRAEGLAANPRVRREKRQEKQEIACWFKVWLEVPDLFFDWLELRKGSEDFRNLFVRDGEPAWARNEPREAAQDSTRPDRV